MQNLGRRSFIKTTTAAAAATLTVERMAHAAPDNRIKVALVGCGGRGTGAANHALHTKTDVWLTALADVDPEQARQSGEILKKQHLERVDVPDERIFSGFDGFRQAFAEADVVVLATPPGFRPAHFEEAVRQGKHVFMEKPVATDVAGIRRVLKVAEEAKKKNLKVAVGMQRRHHPGYIETVQRIQDGAIGDIHTMRAYWLGSSRGGLERRPGETEMQYQIRNWYYFTWLSGDHVVEQHVHNLDVAHWMKGELPVRAHGLGGREVRDDRINGQIFDHHFVEYEYADGARLFSQSCQIPGNCRRNVSEAAVGSKGAAAAANGERLFSITGPNAWEQRLKGRLDAHQLEHFPFFDAIRNDEAYNEARYGAESTMMAILGRMATYSGRVVEWEDAMKMDHVLVPEVKSFDDEPPVMPDAEGFYPTAVPGVSEPW